MVTTPQKQVSFDTYVSAYLAMICKLPFVRRVYADASHGLTIFTIYDGSLFDVGNELMGPSEEVMRRYPATLVDFHFINDGVLGPDAPSPNSEQVYPAA